MQRARRGSLDYMQAKIASLGEGSTWGTSRLKVLQKSVLSYWLSKADDEMLSNLANHCKLVRFGKDESIPESPFYIVVSGLLQTQTVIIDTLGRPVGSVHAPARHGRDSFFAAANAERMLSKPPNRQGVFSCLSCRGGWEDWDEMVSDDDDEEEEEYVETPQGQSFKSSSSFKASSSPSSKTSALFPTSSTGPAPAVGAPSTDHHHRRASQQRASTQGGDFGRRVTIAQRISAGFMSSAPVRTKTITRVTALTDGEVLVFSDMAKIYQLVKVRLKSQGQPRERSRARLHESLHSTAALDSQLLALPLFKECFTSASSRMELRDLVTYCSVPEGEKVSPDGYDGTTFYIVVHGKVNLHDGLVGQDGLGSRASAATHGAGWKALKRASAAGELKGTTRFHERSKGRGAASNSLPPAHGSSSSLMMNLRRQRGALRASFGEGQFFGGAPFFKDAKTQPGREVELCAARRTLLAVVSPTNFSRLVACDARWRETLLLEVKKRLLRSYRAARVPFFSEITDATIARFAELASLTTYTAGARIPSGGDRRPSSVPGSEGATESSAGLYFVADGMFTAKLTKPAFACSSSEPGTPQRATPRIETFEARLTFGNYFGEVGLLLPAAEGEIEYHAAGKDAERLGVGEATLLVLKAAAFHKLFGKDRSLMAELRMRVHGTSTSLATILDHPHARSLFVDQVRKMGKGGETRLRFYEEATQYLQIAPAGFKAAARAIAEGILQEYFPDNSRSTLKGPQGPQRARRGRVRRPALQVAQGGARGPGGHPPRAVHPERTLP
jgi:hypothetical protein